MKIALMTLAILAAMVSPVLATPIFFIADSHHRIADGAPTSPVVFEVEAGDTILLGVFIFTGDYTAQCFHLSLMAPTSTGSWGPPGLGANVTPPVHGPISVSGNVSAYYGSWFFGGYNGNGHFVTFSFTLSESLRAGDSFEIAFYDDTTYNNLEVNGDMRFYPTGSGSVTVNVVPEPATLAVLGIGLAGLLGIRRRRS